MTEKGKGILSYVFSWVGGLIVLYAMKNNERKTKYHPAQGIVIGAGYWAIVTVYKYIPFTIPFLYKIIYALYIILVVMGIVKVCKEEEPELPIIGKIATSIFGKKIEE